MPASTLPTRSAPTSAPLVKMPPPRRAKIEISEAPKPKRHQRIDDFAAIDREAHRAGEDGEIDRNAEKGEAGDQQAGDRARLEGDVEAARQRLGRGLRGAHIGADRDFMPMKPADAGQKGADQEADRRPAAEQKIEKDANDRADDGDGQILPT